MNSIRINKKAFFDILKAANALPEGVLPHQVTALIVWENNTTDLLFDPIHGGDGLLLKIGEGPHDHACTMCGKFFMREDLLAGDGSFLGWCGACDAK